MTSSSLIELKAELSRKKQEAAKKSLELPEYIKGGGRIWKAKAKQLLLEGHVNQLRKKFEQARDKGEKDAIEAAIEAALAKSREALERKSAIYDAKMQKAMQGIFDSDDDKDEDEECLVNFDEKAMDSLRSLKRQQTEKVNSSASSADDDSDDSDWVEYTDRFNRLRRCRKKNLAYYVGLDAEIAKDTERRYDDSAGRPGTSRQDDSEIIEGPIHYETIRNNEVRTHGVGYYQFSTNTEERKRQMNQLNELRADTERKQQIREQQKQKRLQAIEQRLAKIAAKRGIQLRKDSPESDSDSYDSCASESENPVQIKG